MISPARLSGASMKGGNRGSSRIKERNDRSSKGEERGKRRDESTNRAWAAERVIFGSCQVEPVRKWFIRVIK